MITIIDKFKNREVKAKDVFSLREVDRATVAHLIQKYHYIKEGNFKASYCIGMFIGDTLVGAAAFHFPQGVYSLKGWWGLPNSTKDILELTRLCLIPELNGTNATSFLLSGAIRILKKKHNIRAIMSLADSSRHVGSIYQVCNFKYFGITPSTNRDFYSYLGDNKWKKNPRGKISHKKGVWLPRTPKHRYAYILDNNLTCVYEEKPYPSKTTPAEGECRGCGGKGVVVDKRYNDTYDCPLCTSDMEVR